MAGYDIGMNNVEEPRFMYSVASLRGDLAIVGDELQVLLDGCDLGTTYGDYFSAIWRFFSSDDFQMIHSLADLADQSALPHQVHVRAEKHGALYHPASLELAWTDGKRTKYAVLVAMSARGRKALRREALVLGHLHEAYRLPFLPKNLGFVENKDATWLIEPWFSGFHEFHVATNGVFHLWDHDRGLCSLSAAQIRQVFFQAARILTLCVDSEAGACIHPWSHAAGDFVVRNDDHDPDVRLTTARGYGPLIETDNPLSALFAFVLDLTLRIRLDRVDGVGRWVWFGPDILEDAAEGFFSAVLDRGRAAAGLQTLARLLPLFSVRELAQGCEALLDRFSPGERRVVASRLEEHCRELAKALRELLEKTPGAE